MCPAADDRELALMVQVQADDGDAFSRLYDRLVCRAYGVAYGIVKDRSRADDIVQEAFLSVWRSRARFRPELGTVASWVLGIVRHRAIDSLRAQGHRDRRRPNTDSAELRVSMVASIEETAGEREEAARLREALTRLPPAQCEVIALAYFGEMTNTEIARELSLPPGTVKGRMRLGLEKLRHDAIE